MVIGFKVLGLSKATAYIKKGISDSIKKSEEGVKQATLYAEGKVKESIAHGKNAAVAVDTGQFLNSVKGESKGMVGQISSNVKHAPHVEYGTSRMYPRPHFRNTMIVEKDRIAGYIRSKVSEVKR